MTSILLLGYVSSRTKLVTAPQLSGMQRFIGTFCLPAMLFRTLVHTNTPIRYMS
jgi:predicted permease